MTLLASFEEKLSSLIEEHPDLPYHHLFTASRYSLFSQGKRLRPLLLLTTVESYHASLEPCFQIAAAIECVHTYSLIHDDLPCMDDDDLRRGKPTLHKVYEESHALLTGDYLLTFAFELLARSAFSDAKKIAMITTLSERIGAHGMLGGQVLDLTFAGKTLAWDTLELIHRYKTAALITAALELGAIAGDAPKEDLLLMEKIGMAIGFAFQLIDDLLDQEDKDPLSALHFLSEKECTQMALSHLKKAKALLHQLSCDKEKLETVFEKMIHRTV